MELLYLFARLFPIFCLGMLIVFYDVARYYRRKKSKLQYVYIGMMGASLLFAGLWIIFRGDINSTRWVNSIFIVN